MKFLSKIGWSVVVSLLMLVGWPLSQAQAVGPEIVVFERQDCQHCRDAKAFFSSWSVQESSVEIVYRDLANHQDYQVWSDLAERAKVGKVTPLIVIGEKLIVGFDKPETSGELIKTTWTAAQSAGVSTAVEAITSDDVVIDAASAGATCDDTGVPCADPSLTGKKAPMLVSVPLIGAVDVSGYPLALMSAVLGFLDGFNPCAMWVLVTFLVILTQVGDKRKMFLFAGTFILAEAIMYYAILTVWYQTWDFIQLDRFVTPVVALVSLGGGAFFLWNARKKDQECKVTNPEQRKATRDRVMELASKPLSVMTILGILGLAFSVNIIEFACSIGIPQTFTKVLEMNNVSWLAAQGYVALYILMYMVDDFIVFGLALYAIDKIGVTSKYSRYSGWVAGVIMVLLGLLLLFKPELLVF